MARFTVAATPRMFDKTRNEWVDAEAMFLGCTVWRQAAENAAESLTKGMRVIVTGRLRQHHWTTDNGEKRSAFGLDVDEIGPSLRFTTARITRAARGTGTSRPADTPAPADDPFSVPAGTAPGAGPDLTAPPF
ncbi:single-strand binding protein [Candidatus Protofrankia californiensis]|uniref:Single-stranded DNA-binding protein n=1 Tax=Candidatus Protofrankia californiensis TaxID=1839754 RepID=A0A1C3PGP2_9ACTN|nr:single-strand binding protein [Candidatus Protofrankia californiensis]